MKLARVYFVTRGDPSGIRGLKLEDPPLSMGGFPESIKDRKRWIGLDLEAYKNGKLTPEGMPDVDVTECVVGEVHAVYED